MILVVGLGNPTDKYRLNRHNIGFMVIDALINKYKPSLIKKTTFNGELFKFNNILFLKPVTYMNNSGLSVISVSKYFKVDKIIVVHDDLELPFGSVRIKNGGGNGGHNGLKSIDAHFGANYDRIRLGIGKPLLKDEISNYVLSNFSKKEVECLPIIIQRAIEAIIFLQNHTIEETASKYTSKKSLCKNEQESL